MARSFPARILVSLLVSAAVQWTVPGSAGAWEAIWNLGGLTPEVGTHVDIDDDGNVYVAGWALIESRGDSDLIAIKYDPAGVKLWDYQFDAGLHNALGFDEPVGIGTDAAGNVYVAGRCRFQRSGIQDYDYVVIKLSSIGVHQWTVYYDWEDGSSPHGDDRALDMRVDSSGNVWVFGESDDDYLTVKYNNEGVEQWTARYPGDFPGAANIPAAIAVDAAGNAVVTGSSMDASAAYDYVTLKYNSSGVEQWRARYGHAESHGFEAVAVAVDSSGNVAVNGTTVIGDGSAESDMTTVYYNSAGVEQWAQTYSGTGDNGIFDDGGTSVAFDDSGHVIAVGWATMTGTGTDYLVAKYSSAGVEQWTALYNEVPSSPSTGDSYDDANAVAVDGSGGIHVAGSLDRDWMGIALDQTYGVVSFAPDGTLSGVLHFDHDPSLNLPDEALDIAVNGSGIIAVTGTAWGPSTWEDIGTFSELAGSGELVFSDGFETGTANRWSASVGN